MESPDTQPHKTDDTSHSRREAADKAIDHAFSLMGDQKVSEEDISNAFKEADRLLSLCDNFDAAPDFVK